VVVGVKEKANVGGVGVGRGRNEVFGFSVNRMAGSNEAGKGSKFAADGTEGIADGIAGGSLVVAAGEEVVTVEVKGALAGRAKGVREVGREDGEIMEAAEEAELVVGWCEAVVGILAGEVMEGHGKKHGVGKGG
jgi:hypothetical protein